MENTLRARSLDPRLFLDCMFHHLGRLLQIPLDAVEDLARPKFLPHQHRCSPRFHAIYFIQLLAFSLHAECVEILAAQRSGSSVTPVRCGDSGECGRRIDSSQSEQPVVDRHRITRICGSCSSTCIDEG